MNADTLANVTQVVATLIALVGLAVTFVFSYRGQRLQKLQAAEAAAQAAESNRAAQAAAQRAAASAALTIDDLARIAGALERLVAEGRSTGAAGSRFEATTAPATVAWQLTHDGGDAYRLTNVGAAPAFDVWVGGAASLAGPHDLPPTAQIVTGASVVFRAAVVPTTVDSTITVTWAASHGAADRSSWRYPLPGA